MKRSATCKSSSHGFRRVLVIFMISECWISTRAMNQRKEAPPIRPTRPKVNGKQKVPGNADFQGLNRAPCGIRTHNPRLKKDAALTVELKGQHYQDTREHRTMSSTALRAGGILRALTDDHPQSLRDSPASGGEKMAQSLRGSPPGCNYGCAAHDHSAARLSARLRLQTAPLFA